MVAAFSRQEKEHVPHTHPEKRNRRPLGRGAAVEVLGLEERSAARRRHAHDGARVVANGADGTSYQTGASIPLSEAGVLRGRVGAPLKAARHSLRLV